MSWRPSANLQALAFRAETMAACRHFFQARDVLEVSTPALSACATTEPNIRSFTVNTAMQPGVELYLHSSPELPMKRLLAAGSGPIFQIGSVFRDNDQGRHHRPEFTLLEWYRPGWDYHRLMDEVEALVRAMPSQVPIPAQTQCLSYRELFQQYLSFDPLTADIQACQRCCQQHDVAVPDAMEEDIDPWLDLLLSVLIAPRLPGNELTFVYDFPASQAALACLRRDEGAVVAERFELYWGQLELANGFQELGDAEEQRRRFEQENARRQQLGLLPMPLDEKFLSALTADFPQCSGVALGIDRLLMALSGAEHIREVIAFADEL